MTLLPFAAEAPIDHRILAAQNDDLSGDALLREIAAATLYVPSRDDVREDGSRFQPVLIEQAGDTYVTVYTARSRVPADTAPHLLQTAGSHFFRRLPQGYGVIVHPGYAAQILIPPHGVAAFQQDLRRTP